MSVFSKADTYSVVELACLWILVHLFVRHVLLTGYSAKFTVHRGIFHSQLAAVFFLFLSAAAAISPLWLATVRAWLVGCFVALGYIDPSAARRDLQRVDLTGARVKKSFWPRASSSRAWTDEFKTSVALGAATVAVFFLAAPAVGVLCARARKSENTTQPCTSASCLRTVGSIFRTGATSKQQAGSRTDDDALATGSITRGKLP
jgi:hypothetical protein